MKKWNILLLIIVGIGFLLRFYQLGIVPHGFDADEASFGYNSYSLLLTGKDEYGHMFPLVLKAFGDYKPALYAYLDVPFVFLFGLTPFAVRIVSALFGTATILLLFFLCNKLFIKKETGLVAALLLAISPWHIILSRTVSEVVLAVFFLLVVLYALIKLSTKYSTVWFSTALISGIFAVLSYTGARFFLLIIACVFLLFSFINKKVKFEMKGNSILLIFFFLICVAYNFIGSTERFGQIDIFHTPQTQLVLDEQIREDSGLSPWITRIFHNKAINYLQTVGENYAQYFTPDFLFFHGGYPLRVHLPNSGLFFLWELPFLLIGIYFLFKGKSRYGFLCFSLILLLIIPAAITFDEIPNIYRTLIILPFVLMVIAVGITSIRVSSKSKTHLMLLSVVTLSAIYSLGFFLHDYFVHQETHQPWYRGYANKILAQDLQKYYPSYKKIIITKAHPSPYIYILFFQKYDPHTYQREGSPRDLDFSGFDKYYFVPHDCLLTLDKSDNVVQPVQKNTLYVEAQTCDTPDPATGMKLIDTIRWQDNTVAFKLFSLTSGSPTNYKN